MRRTCQKIRTIDQIYDLSIGDTIVIVYSHTQNKFKDMVILTCIQVACQYMSMMAKVDKNTLMCLNCKEEYSLDFLVKYLSRCHFVMMVGSKEVEI
jgi:hypothetical protein